MESNVRSPKDDDPAEATGASLWIAIVVTLVILFGVGIASCMNALNNLGNIGMTPTVKPIPIPAGSCSYLRVLDAVEGSAGENWGTRSTTTRRNNGDRSRFNSNRSSSSCRARSWSQVPTYHVLWRRTLRTHFTRSRLVVLRSPRRSRSTPTCSKPTTPSSTDGATSTTRAS